MATLHHNFRFGVAVGSFPAGTHAWTAAARRVEALGYSSLLLPDLIGTAPGPLTALAIAAATTTRLRIGTWVLSNDFRHPVMLAREASTLDLLTDGRFQLGLGAGRVDNGYRTLGIPTPSAGMRVSRLAESVQIINALFRGEQVSFAGTHYTIANATLQPPPTRKVGLLLAAGGRRTIELAAAEADTVAFSSFDADELAQQLHWLKAAAGPRYPDIELALRLRIDSNTPAHSDPDAYHHILPAAPEAMLTHLQQVREHYGISYIVVDHADARTVAQVIDNLTPAGDHTTPPTGPA
jgi:probable F420-dependent oxidoreductase